MQRHDSRHNEVIFHAEARWLSRGKVVECVFQLWQEFAGFSCSKGYPISTDFQGNFWLCLNLNSFSWIVQPFTYGEIALGFSHVAATTQETTGHGTRNTKINGSQSSCSWSLYTTQYESKNKSSDLLWLLPLNFIRQLWKMWFQPCFKGVEKQRLEKTNSQLLLLKNLKQSAHCMKEPRSLLLLKLDAEFSLLNYISFNELQHQMQFLNLKDSLSAANTSCSS